MTSSLLPLVTAPRGATTWLLVRHGESQANAEGENEQDTDSPLTARGERQAQLLAAAFGATRVGAIVSSDSQRARNTVAPLAVTLGLPVTPLPVLREPRSNRRAAQFADAGQAAALLEQFRAGQLPAPVPPPETHADVVARLRRFLATVERPASPEVLVVCSHYVTLNVLVRLLLDARDPPAALWAHFDNGSVTRVDVPPSRQPPVGILVYLNWVPPGG